MPDVSEPGQSHEAKATTSTDEEVRRIAQFFRWAANFLTNAIALKTEMYLAPVHWLTKLEQLWI